MPMNRRQRRKLAKKPEAAAALYQKRMAELEEEVEFREKDVHHSELTRKILLDVFVSAMNIERTPANITEAREYVLSTEQMGEKIETMGWYLDKLFRTATGKEVCGVSGGISGGVSARVSRAAESEQVCRIINEMKYCLKEIYSNAKTLLGSRISALVSNTDDLEKRLCDACKPKRAEILELDKLLTDMVGDADDDLVSDVVNSVMDKLGVSCDSNEEYSSNSYSSKSDAELEEQAVYDVTSDDLVDSIVRPILLLEGIKLGVPTDFYSDVVNIVTSADADSAVFFAKELYTHMSSKEFLYKEIFTYSDGYVNMRSVLANRPEQALPELDYFENLKNFMTRLERLYGGQSALKCILTLHKAGISYENVLAKLEAARFSRDSYTTVYDILSHSEGFEEFMLGVLSDNKSAISLYTALKIMGVDSQARIQFIRDYSSYKVNHGTLSDMLIKNKSRSEMINLVVENALYLCCTEFVEEMLLLAAELDKGTKALRQYIGYAKTEQPFKQEAIVKYLMSKGASRVHKFAEYLDQYADAEVGAIMAELSDEDFFSKINSPQNEELKKKSADERVRTYQEGIYQELTGLKNSDMIANYCLDSEISKLNDIEGALQKLDIVLSSIRASKYEIALLGQKNMCSSFFECMKKEPCKTTAAMESLPADGNPYLVLSEKLRNILNPDEAQERLQPQAQETSEKPARQYSRIIIVASDLPHETLQYIETKAGLPLQVISVDASTNKFNGIREGDLVVYDTTNTSHCAYYRTKALAAKRNAEFRHASQTNKEALLNTIGIIRS